MKKFLSLLVVLGVINSSADAACIMQKSSALDLAAGENFTISSIIDTQRGFAYLYTDTFPKTKIIKINLTNFTEVGSIDGEDFPFWSAAIDTAGGFAYFGLGTIPAKVLKVNLNTFTKVGVLTLNSGENYVTSMAIDPAGGSLYVGTGENPGRIVKINLGTFTRTSAITLATGEDRLQTAVIDTTRGFVYFGTGSTPGRVVKVNIAGGAFSKVSTLALNSDESFLQPGAVVDTTAGFAYFPVIHPTNSSTKIVKVNISPTSFARVGSISPSMTYALHGYINSGVIDPARGYAYFGTGNGDAGPSIIFQIDLSNFSEVGKLDFAVGENSLKTAMIDTAAGFAYFPTMRSPGKVHKIAVGNCGTQQVHPADTDNNFQMGLDEATKYAACWKNPAIFGDCQQNIAIDYAVRAGTLWGASGDGQYHFVGGQTCPLCWVTGP